jgi:hypothetical protein
MNLLLVISKFVLPHEAADLLAAWGGLKRELFRALD